MYSCIQIKNSLLIFWPSFSVNCERTRRRPSWLKQPISCSTRLSHTTCGTTLLAGSRSAAGLDDKPEPLAVRYELHHRRWTWISTITQTDPKICLWCRWTVNGSTRAPRPAGSSDPLELSLVEFCQLVDFLLDIVSLVRSFYLSIYSFILSIHLYTVSCFLCFLHVFLDLYFYSTGNFFHF